MHDVTFSYVGQPQKSTATADQESAQNASQHDVLEHFNLDVPVTGILGLRGASGRGKSTVLKLLMRYFDPQSGSVTMSGRELPNVDASYRRHVQAMMGQQTYLFDTTIRENLLLANGGASDEQLREALKQASALTLVESMPHGLDTQVGELGSRLSEGERQRIGLARVFLRNADLILLDEPTSRLDSLNEATILQSINRLAESRTRLSEPEPALKQTPKYKPKYAKMKAKAQDASAKKPKYRTKYQAMAEQIQATQQAQQRSKSLAIVLVSHRESTMRICDEVIDL
ncbi:ATP-binding cassette domain-containing protein [Bifidobacterium dolichotidis]